LCREELQEAVVLAYDSEDGMEEEERMEAMGAARQDPGRERGQEEGEEKEENNKKKGGKDGEEWNATQSGASAQDAAPAATTPAASVPLPKARPDRTNDDESREARVLDFQADAVARIARGAVRGATGAVQKPMERDDAWPASAWWVRGVGW
jgi:hypothetical protein